ncbi:Hypothetical predicted protein [Olea europaea subsp. europaea]|uniref:Uncharacterized protein n=1 Tax=Olea europaea subsp. europaea TaxID=158383 RepID=A0A8S0RM30_OLEEU|nr:Hypothetical predicted protein [Olea europaea subsp. europaea]
MEGDEEWIKEAMADDTMVVELLVRLKKCQSMPPPPPPPPLKWSVRQRRSKPVAVDNVKNPAPRASPTTPLSWSGATCLSGGAIDGCPEESSRSPTLPKLYNSTRSKINGTSEQNNKKRSRKKKTLAELKEEENLLLKERRELKMKVAAFRVNLEKQRDTNESLKRMKIELQLEPDRGTFMPHETISCQIQQEVAVFNPNPPIMHSIVSGSDDLLQRFPSNGCQNTPAAPKSKFALPDLNIPCEEESSYEVIRAICKSNNHTHVKLFSN